MCINDTFTKIVKDLSMFYNKTCPLITNKLSKKRFLNKPWIWNTIRKCIFKKNKLYKRYIQNKTVLNKLSYTSYKNILTTILRYVEHKYYNDKFKTHSNNPKQMWKAIKQLIEYTSKSKDTTLLVINLIVKLQISLMIIS